jgi:hypothetical protein
MDRCGFTVTSIVLLVFGILWAVMNIAAIHIDDNLSTGYVQSAPGDTPNNGADTVINYYDSYHRLANSLVLWSFLAYSLFRTFLYPFVFAYIADVCGYKYFGILGGVLFVSGAVVSVFTIPLSNWAMGDCHAFNNVALGGDSNANSEAEGSAVAEVFAHCSHGQWNIIFFVIALSFGALLLAFPTFDLYYRRQLARRQGGSSLLSGTGGLSGYGSVATEDDSASGIQLGGRKGGKGSSSHRDGDGSDDDNPGSHITASMEDGNMLDI